MITIVQAQMDEWSLLQDLNNEVFIDNTTYDPDLVLDWAHSELGAKYFKELVHNHIGLCLLAKDDGKAVGYIAASPKHIDYRKSRYLEIENMGVTPAYRSKGIGRQLIQTCKDWAKAQGFQKLFVNTYIMNTKAFDFYKKNGFEVIDISLEQSI